MFFWKASLDERRHHSKVRAALASGDAGRVCREEVVVPGESRHTRISFLSLKEYGFIFDSRSRPFLGQDTGHGEGSDNGEAGAGLTKKPVGEMDLIPMDPVPKVNDQEAVRGWVLPGMEVCSPGIRQLKEESSLRAEWRGLDARRTLLANMKRNALKGCPGIQDISVQDLKFRSVQPDREDSPVPVMLLMRDASDSMGLEKRELCRRIFSLIADFIKREYPEAVMVYLVHDVRAREVKKRDFMFLANCGGTLCSSAYRLALDILTTRFRGRRYRCYALHVSDGDNMLPDNLKCRGLLEEILPRTSRCAYLQAGRKETKAGNSLLSVLSPLANSAFLAAEVYRQEDVSPVLSRFFSFKNPAATGG